MNSSITRHSGLADAADERPTPWTWASYAYACITWLGLTYILVRMPFQVDDFVGNLLQLRHASLWDIVRAQFGGGQYLRPFVWGFFKVVFDASQGHYFAAYKTVEVVQVGLLFWLFVRLLKVRTGTDFLLVPFVMTVLVGLHTFGGFVWENYPINTYLTIAVLVLAAINLSESGGGWRADVAAAVLLVLGMFMIETGLLVWVALAGGYLAGARGVSRRGITLSTALFISYFVFRFVVLSGGTPGLDERSTGFGFGALDPAELQARFGSNPLFFYASNVASSMASLLCAEPRHGVWEFTRALVTDRYPTEPWMVINVVASTLTTLVILGYSIPRLSRWVRLDVRADERLVVVFWILACANATFGYAYTKDQIISVAGCVYPLAAWIAIRALLRRLSTTQLAARVVVASVMVVMSTAWTVRTVGLHYVLHDAAYRHLNDWATQDSRTGEEQAGKNADERAFVSQMKDQMLLMRVPHPSRVYGRWGDRYFDRHP